MVRRNLFYISLPKYKSRQQGCEQRKTPTQQYVQDMTEILHDAENCSFGDNGFNGKSVSPKSSKYSFRCHSNIFGDVI